MAWFEHRVVTRWGGVIAILTSLFAGNARALDPRKPFSQYVHDVWRTEDGLPQNTVDDIIQTRDGYIWLATQEGLVRFDGLRFTVYDRYNTEAFFDSKVNGLTEDPSGVLWISSSRGLLRYAGGEFSRFTTDDGLPNVQVNCVLATDRGDIWIGTRSGLARYRDGTFTSWTKDDGLADDNISALAVARDGSLWIGTASTLLRYHQQQLETQLSGEAEVGRGVLALLAESDGTVWVATWGGGLHEINRSARRRFGSQQGLPAVMMTSLLRDRDGSLWIGTQQDGLVRFRDGTFSSLTTDHGLSSSWIESLFEDREGNLWVGTGTAGINRFWDGRFTSLMVADGLLDDNVWGIYETPDGTVWIGTDRGATRLRGGRADTFASDCGLANGGPATFLEHGGDLWIGTENGLSRLSGEAMTSFTTGDGLAHPDIRSLLVDRRGVIWIGTHGGGVNRFVDGAFEVIDTGRGLVYDDVTSMLEDHTGAIWIATDQGMSRYRDGVLTSFKAGDGFIDSGVYSFHEDKDRTLWIGTDSGLFRFRDGQFFSLSKAQGLPSDTAYTILEDDNGFLWMSSNHGIYRARKSDLNAIAAGVKDRLESTLYGREDGMRSSECNFAGGNAGWRMRDGRLWFSTIAGVAIIDPNRISQSEPPLVAIETVGIENPSTPHPVLVAADELHDIPPGTSKIEIRYTALGLPAPKKARFRYKLEGYDQDWVEAGTRRTAFYTNLAPGPYRFRVIACNNDSVWNEMGSTLPFFITPHFYQTRWFIALCVLSGVCLLGLGYGARVRQLKARERELQELVAERTKDIKEYVDEIENLEAIVKCVNRETDLQSLLDTLLLQAFFLFPQAEKGAVLLTDQEGDLFRAVTTAGYERGAMADVTLTRAEVIARYTEGTKELRRGIWLLRDVTGAAGGEKLRGLPAAKSLLAMSVTLEGQVEGFLVLDNMTNREAFDDSDVQKLARFREHAISAISKARILEALRGQQRRLIELDEQKTRFFANISHEFRTPLTLIMGPLEEALEGNYRPVRRRDAESMLRNTRRLLRLINQLLDISKLEAGKMKLRARPGDLIPFLGSSIAAFESAAERKGICLELETDQESIAAYFDPEKLERVVFNLLSNAVKFTNDKGRILVRADATEAKVTITVRDSGEGIPPEQLPYIFDRFLQGDSSSTRQREGTGIGLALVKEFVELHHGTIRAESKVGFGTEFAVELPRGRDHLAESEIVDVPFGLDTAFGTKERPDRRKADRRMDAERAYYTSSVELAALDEPEARSAPPPGATEDETRAIILVVEDNTDMRAHIRGVLEPGYRVVEAENGEEGIAAARSYEPRLIISDVMMPKMDGCQMLAALRGDERTRHIPVIMMTAKASDEMRIEGLELGADEYLAKPFNPRELRVRVKNLLQRLDNERRLEELNRHLTETVLKRFLPGPLVDEIVSGKRDLEQEPRQAFITILFSDLSGFTKLTEKLRAVQMAKLMNEYLAKMVDVIFAHGGTIDKFIGDAVMVIFGAPLKLDPPEQAERAVKCATGMHAAMAELNQAWQAKGLPELRMRIGIHHGPAVVGTFGSAERSDYTALGPTVNMASRIESACEPGATFVSAGVCDYMLNGTFEEAGAFELKGIEGKVTCYRITGA